MADSTSLSILRQTPLSSSIATKQWTEDNFLPLSAQVRQAWYGECSTAQSTKAKTVEIPGITELQTGLQLRIKFTEAQRASSPTLNVNSLGAHPIIRSGTTAVANYEWLAGEVIDLVFDGTAWIVSDGGIATTSYYGYTKLYNGATSTSTSLALAPAALNSYSENTVVGAPALLTTSTYSVGDRVRYQFNTYECISDVQTPGAWASISSHFKELDPIQIQIDNLSDAVANIDVPEVEGKFVHLSGDTVSADFTLKIAGNNVLSGLDRNLAIGKSSQATGNSSTALGRDSKAIGYYSTALGYGAKATGNSSTAIGNSAQASADYSTAIGYNSKVLGDNSAALGNGAQATGSSSTALGYGAKATGNSSTAIGNSAQASSLQSTAVGNSAQVTNSNSTALGYGAKALSAYSTALGNNTKTAGQRAIAIGYRTAATATNAIQIGTVDNNDLSNNVADTLQIWDKPLLKRTDGKIFIERIPALPISLVTNLQTTLDSKLSGVKMNGSNVTVTNGVADLSTVLTAHQSLSDLYVLSGEVVEGLSNVVIPKLDTISGLVEDEVEKVDEISAKLDDYSLTGHTHTSSDITNFPPVPTNTNQLVNGAGFITSSQVDTKIAALDGAITGSAGAGKTLTSFSQTDGKVTAGFGDISITKSQISDFPTIPTVNNGTLTIQRNGSTVQTFTANQSTAVSANIIVPTKTSELTNDSGFVVSSDLTKVMEYQGSVTNFSDLPNNAKKGAVYDVISAYNDNPPGTNYAWSGTSWDPLGGSIDVSKFATKTQLEDYLPLSGGSIAGALSANNGFHADGYSGTTGLSIGNGENDEYYTHLIATIIKTQQSGGGVVFENGYGYGLSVDAGFASNFYGAYLNATKVKSEELFVNADIYEGGGLSVGQGTDDIYGTYINATNLTAPGMIAGINNTTPHGGLSVTGIDFGDGSYLSSANGFALVSNLNKLSGEVVNGLSAEINPKLSVIADKVEEEVAKLDELSGKLSGYAYKDHTHSISAITNLQTTLDSKVSAVTVNGSKKTPTNGTIDLGVVAGTLNTTLTASQSTNASEKLSGNINLHKISKTGAWNDLLNKPNSFTPTSHAVTSTTYGKGNGSNYGHVKLSDVLTADTSLNSTNGGTAATPYAVSQAILSAKNYTDNNFLLKQERTILPIVSNNNLTVTLSSDVKTYRITDSSGNGTFPTLAAPTNISDFGDCYYAFELEWLTNSTAASFPQTADWINYPEIQSDGQQHTYYITGRYDSTNTEYTMNCWRVK